MRNYNELMEHIYEKGNSVNFEKCENVSLALLKLIKKDIVEQTKNKRNFLQSINKIKIPVKLSERIKKEVVSLERLEYRNIFSNEKDKCLKLKTSSRLVVGLGAGHVLETSLTLHHIFGIPYIPASALKGVVRMVSFWEIAENKKIKDEREIEKLQEQTYDKQISDSDDEDIVRHKLLFGTQNFKGLLIFLDAYPEIQDNQGIFELDVMTPHYSGYYTKDQAPGDWENPKPIVFLTVKKGITFCFNVLFDEFRAKEILKDKNFSQEVRKIIEEWLINSSILSNLVKNWIEDALKEYGVGAKTRLGYGIFE